MKILNVKQLSPEWFDFKVGKISGTRFGQAISVRKNRLIYDLLDERLKGYIEQSEFETDEMRFGTENEPIARKMYIDASGIRFEEVGAIISDFSDIHMASPDGLNQEKGIVLEIKCTQNGGIHIQRFFDGAESNYLPQIINYFAVSDEVKEVHFVSYDPYVQQKQLIVTAYTRETIISQATKTKKAETVQDIVNEGRWNIGEIEKELIEKEGRFIF